MKSFAILALSLVLAGCSRRSAPPAGARVNDATKPLIFLTHPTQPPCSYIDDKGECAGTDVELARKIAAKMGRTLLAEAAEFETIMPRLKAGTADFAIATITITEARKRDVDFSAPYATGGNCFLYRADGPKPHMSAVATLRVGAEFGTTADLYLCRHGCDPIRFAHIVEAVESLRNGAIDAVFFDSIPLGDWAAESGGKLVVSPIETREGYGVAVDKRRPDVLAAANAVIAGGGAL